MISRGAAVLIYVLDIMSEKPNDDLKGFADCIQERGSYFRTLWLLFDLTWSVKSLIWSTFALIGQNFALFGPTLYFEPSCKAIAKYSENSKVFVLVHKMDLLNEENAQEPGIKEKKFAAKKAELEEIASKFSIKVIIG